MATREAPALRDRARKRADAVRTRYSTIGVVFSLLTWFFLIGAVVVLGVVSGATWQAHAEHR